jgi:hypothetical protein
VQVLSAQAEAVLAADLLAACGPGLAWGFAELLEGELRSGDSDLGKQSGRGGPAPAARLCAATPGEPVWLSLRALDGEWSIATGSHVFVCENPTIVEAAADELGSHCPPIVCTDGIPTMAALDLLAGLWTRGSSTSVRADVDEAGLVVVEQVLSVANEATLWRYDTATYAAHLGLPDQRCIDEWRHEGAVGSAPRPVPATRHPAPRRGPTERAPAGPDRVQVANLQLTSDQAVHVAALRRRGGGNLHRHGAARHRPRRCASAEVGDGSAAARSGLAEAEWTARTAPTVDPQSCSLAALIHDSDQLVRHG